MRYEQFENLHQYLLTTCPLIANTLVPPDRLSSSILSLEMYLKEIDKDCGEEIWFSDQVSSIFEERNFLTVEQAFKLEIDNNDVNILL